MYDADGMSAKRKTEFETWYAKTKMTASCESDVKLLKAQQRTQTTRRIRRHRKVHQTWELLLRGKSTRMPPEPLEIIGRKEKLKLLGVTFAQVPVNWDTHIDYLLSKASSRLYIIRICKYYGYSIENLDLLFQSLILSVFTYAVEVRGAPFITNI